MTNPADLESELKRIKETYLFLKQDFDNKIFKYEGMFEKEVIKKEDVVKLISHWRQEVSLLQKFWLNLWRLKG